MRTKDNVALVYLKTKKYEGLSWKQACLYLSFDMAVSLPAASTYLQQLEKAGEINAEGKIMFLKKKEKKQNGVIN